MRKTVALFVLAFALLVVASVVGLKRPVPPADPGSPTPPLTQVDPTPASGSSSSTLRMGDLVELDGRLSNAFIRKHEAGSLSLLLDLVGREDSRAARPAVAVAVVIDRSGSMQGEKIERAREAAKQFAARLSDDDQLAIVTYSSDFSVDLPLTTIKGQRARIDRVVDEILDGGGTDIGGGLQAGVQALRGAASGSVRRLLLVSDGNANQGITDPSALAAIAREARQEGVTVSTLGVGLDFNEDLLAHMAQSAGGSYTYVRDGAALAGAFERELAGIRQLAARQVEVGLELREGVQIKQVFGYRTETRSGRIVVPVGDIASGERRRVLVELALAHDAPRTADELEVAGLVLSYASPGRGDLREHRGALSVVASTDPAELARGERPEVIAAFEAAYAAEAREHAVLRFQAGNKAQALRKLEEQIQATQRRNTTLKSPELERQVLEMQEAFRGISASSAESDAAKDLVKSEKARARQVFAY